ncbi:MAG: carboxypeptidase regulatory-like domain-containing protein, partial [Myxococcales bacterium]|nr:carboxypeptidase regulatory-like domain-containing protein [Myxococcales bacterium]
DAAARPAGMGDVTGQVHFRLYDESHLPVAYPIVYWDFPDRRPAPLTRGATCDCGDPPTAARGEADGSFTLRNIPAGPVWLVVQKGGFRRITQVEVVPGAQTRLPDAATELPVRQASEAGEEIPRIAIGTGRFDPIEDVFARLRLGPITPDFHFDYARYEADPAAWGLDLFLYQPPREVEDNDRELLAPSWLALLQRPDDLFAYDFLFGPCADTTDYAAALTSPLIRQHLAQYVNNGGKLYATDYSYLLVEQTFPAHIDFGAPEGRDGNADGHVGDRAFMQLASQGTLRYASQNRASPPPLRAWLEVLGISAQGFVPTEGNWVNIRGVGTIEACCREGQRVAITPEVVMSGPNGVDPFVGNFGPSHATWAEAEAEGANYPHTLRFPHGCGEVMYSTYHTAEEAGAVLTPQELVLLYLILEIGECNLDPVKE